jgi:cellulose synthase (UDP-forming)
MREADELGREFNVTVYRRDLRHGAKAGIINDALAAMTEKYLVIFDADQNPMPDFLKKILPIIESDPKIAFVQTPQIYTNTLDNPIAEAAAMQQAIFYESICEGKSMDNAMFCCGTNVIFRISALRAVGSFDEKSITEDFATAIKLHMAGNRSVYYNHAIAFGMAPESLPAYFKQQSRWATGTVGVLRTIMEKFAESPGKLTPAQWWEYFLASSYYLIGWVYFYLMLAPVLFLIFDIPSFFLSPAIYIATFLPYFLLSSLVFYSSVSDRGYTVRQIYSGMIANFLCFPVLMRATFLGLIGKRAPFTITPKNGRETLSFKMMLPYIVMLALNLAALAMAPYKISANPTAIAINSFWVMYHIWLLSHIFALNK